MDPKSSRSELSSQGAREILAPLREQAPQGPRGEGPQGGAGAGGLVRGEVIGRYQIEGSLGFGGMGMVYSAHDPELGRTVAIKLLRSTPEGGPGVGDRARLQREAHALARLSHPNVVAVYDVGTHADRMWIAMERVTGETLRAWTSGRRRSWAEVLDVMTAVAMGVAAAHAVHLVHRDLKPDNVMLGRDGRVRVMDFGLVQQGVPGDEHGTTAHEGEGFQETGQGERITCTGMILGSPAYMAPEQWNGQEIGPAADLFAWSVTAWELLFGERPFAGDTLAELRVRVLAGRTRDPPRGRRVPRWLLQIVERGLCVDPALRWASMEALLHALARGEARTRMRRAALVLVALSATGGGFVACQQWDTERRTLACEVAGAEIEKDWNADTRQAIEAAFLATGVSYAATTVDRVLPRLDAQAEAWGRAQTAGCLMADVAGRWSEDIHDRALWCLDDRRLAFVSLLGEFKHPDATTVQKAVTAAASLRAVGPCLDAGWLERQPLPPQARRTVVRAVRADLARATSLQLAGQSVEGLKFAQQARERAETGIDWPALLASAYLHEGGLLRDTGKHGEAEEKFSTAYFMAIRAGVWDVAADSARNLISTVGNAQARPGEGRAWARHAEVAAYHAGDSLELREASRLNDLGALHEFSGDYKNARESHERAVALRERALGPEHPLLASSLGNLATTLARTGAYAEAKTLQQRALAIREKAQGHDHPALAANLTGLGMVYYDIAEFIAARRLHSRALNLLERALPPGHPNLAVSLTNLANTHSAVGEYRTARVLHQRALTIWEAAYGPEHPHVGSSLDNLANMHAYLGEYATAKALHERALAIRVKQHGPDHAEVGTSLYNLGVAVVGMKDYEEAGALFQRALEVREKALGPDHGDVAYPYLGLADVHAARGEYAEAQRLCRRALAIFEKAQGPDHVGVAATLGNIGLYHLGEKRPREAIAPIKRALAIFAALPGVQEGEFAAHFNLAKALAAMGGEGVVAIAEAEKARDGFREAGLASAEELVEVEAWLADRRRSLRSNRSASSGHVGSGGLKP